jgi:hypothetical protein
MMKLAAVLLLAATTSVQHSRKSTTDPANVVRTITMYDTECGRVAPEIVDIVRKFAGVVDRGELLTAQLTVDHQIATAGRAEWCRPLSRGVAEATAILDEPPSKGIFSERRNVVRVPYRGTYP